MPMFGTGRRSQGGGRQAGPTLRDQVTAPVALLIP